MAKLDPIFQLYEPIEYSFNKKKEDYIIIAPTVGSQSQINDGGRVTFEINSLSNWLLLSDAYFRCDFKIKDGAQNQDRIPQQNLTLENNFFPSLFSEMVLEAGSNTIETIKHPGEFDTMLKTLLYPKDYTTASGWIPDTGDGKIQSKQENVAADANQAAVRTAVNNLVNITKFQNNEGYKKRVVLYNNNIDGNSWGSYINWPLYPLFGLLERRKVYIGLPFKIHLQRLINNDRIFFGENNSNAKLEITNIQLYVPVITPTIEVETRLLSSLKKDIDIAFLRRNTIGSITITGENYTWQVTNTTKPARYLILGFKTLPDSQTNNNNHFKVTGDNFGDPKIKRVQVRLNNENYPNIPLKIDFDKMDLNELYRNYKLMSELFGNVPQFNYTDFVLNYPIFCFDLSAHKEDLFKTGVQLSVYIEKTAGDMVGYCLLLEESRHIINIMDRKMNRIE